jgi:hypothetical protein
MAKPVPDIHDGSANFGPTAFQVISEDGAITLGKELVILTYAGATAITLAAPTNPDMDGFRMDIVSTVAQAHVVTATNLLNGDNDTLTWGGAVGDACGLVAYGGEWFTTYLTNVTVG